MVKVQKGRDWPVHLISGFLYAPITGLVSGVGGAVTAVVANIGVPTTLIASFTSPFAIIFSGIGIAVGLFYGLIKSMAAEDAQS